MARSGKHSGHMRWVIRFLVISQLTLLASCASTTTTTTTEPLLLQHPGTGHTVECYPAVQDCMTEYQVQGYVSVSR